MNMTLQQAVRDELMAEPKVEYREIAVAAEDGVVTLRGTVGSLRQKVEAGRAAKRVQGVKEVRNDLDVRLLVGDRRENAELRGAVLQALALDSLVPSTIDATMDDGVATLTGTVNWQYQREEAEFIASNVRGVRGIRSEIVLVPTPSAVDIKQSIEQRLQRNAALDASRLAVATKDGAVTLTGFVSSWAAHDEAVAAAWATPNVTKVHDFITVQ
jgi:osmotically-inducible protein OsmY